MKITKRQLRRIIKEEKAKLFETGFHSMSSVGKSLAKSIKGKFMRMYPDARVGIDGRGGFITVNGKKAIDMSQATGRVMSDDEMIEKMHAAYAETQIDDDIPTADSRMDTFRESKMKITKRQLRRIIREAWAGRRDPLTGRGGPASVQEWEMWGDTFDLSPEYDNDGQLIFYLSPSHRDRVAVAAEALKAGANVDTDYEGNDIIYTNMTDMGPM